MERLRREMNRLFSDWPTRARSSAATSYPAMNLWVDDNSAIATAELPGMLLDQIDISVEDDTLTLRGSRQPDSVEGVTYHRRERRHGSFVRTSKMPFRVDVEKVDATFKNGVLRIILPRAEADKPKKIAVRAG
jgi:HSP20 family protein